MNAVLLGLLFLPAIYLIVRIASAAYFQQKIIYHRALMSTCVQTEGVNDNGIQAKTPRKGF